MTLPRRLVAAAAAVALLVPAAAASASQVTSSSDLVGTPPLDYLTTEVTTLQSYLQSQYCNAAAAKPKTLTLATAVKNATTYIDKNSSAGARHKFASAPAAKTEHGSLTAAASAAGANSQVGALDALLRAHKLAPKDPMPLIDAAPLLTDASKPNEALAFLAAAAKLPAPDHQPWGFPTKALIANNKGYALLALDKWSDAQAALSSAIDAAPMLSEAELNLAAADICQGNAKKAARMMFFGVRRDPSFVGDMIDEGIGDPTPSQAGVDIGRGAKITLPTYDWPQNMAEGKLMATGMRTDMFNVESRNLDLTIKVNQLQTQLSSELQSANAATRRRTNDLVGVARSARSDPTVTPLADKVSELELKLSSISTKVIGQTFDCSGGASEHAMWLGVLGKYDKAVRADIATEYQLETAVGANLSNKTAHQLVMTDASGWAQTLLAGILQQGNFLTMWDEACSPNDPPGNVDPIDDPTDDRPTSPRCPSGLEGKGWQLNIGPVQVSVDCESVAAEIDTGGWIGAFGNVSHNFRNGSTTIFAGPRAKANPGPWGPNVNFKDGLYMTFDSSGQVQDLGARVETGSELNLGPAGGATFSGDSMNFSIVGAMPIASMFTF